MENIQWIGDVDDIIWFGRHKSAPPAKRPKLEMANNAIYNVGTDIHFTTDINAASIQTIIRIITDIIEEKKSQYENSNDKLQIVYIVDSPGGSVSSVLKFVDFLDLTKKKYPFVEFISIISGSAASAGTIMAIVADKRYMTQHAVAMIHELSSRTEGTYTHLNSRSKHYTTLHDIIVNIYVSKTGLDRNYVNELLNKETWFNAQDYLTAKFIDGIK